MDKYKDKYDNIVFQLFELVQKKRELDKAEKELQVNSEKIKVCSDELSKLVGKIHEMKHSIIDRKSSKCMNKFLLFFFVSGFIFLYVGVNFVPSLWLAVLYIFLNTIAFKKMYLRKVNDKDYMFGELELNLEYKELIKQNDFKRQQLNDLTNEEEMLNELVSDLYLEIEYLHMFISEIVDEKEIDDVLENSKEFEIESVIDNSLVRKRLKENGD